MDNLVFHLYQPFDKRLKCEPIPEPSIAALEQQILERAQALVPKSVDSEWTYEDLLTKEPVYDVERDMAHLTSILDQQTAQKLAELRRQ
ncbi:hypothetical protein RCL1_002176 [Eukaryota sp. TZLM3-RCL]